MILQNVCFKQPINHILCCSLYELAVEIWCLDIPNKVLADFDIFRKLQFIGYHFQEIFSPAAIWMVFVNSVTENLSILSRKLWLSFSKLFSSLNLQPFVPVISKKVLIWHFYMSGISANRETTQHSNEDKEFLSSFVFCSCLSHNWCIAVTIDPNAIDITDLVLLTYLLPIALQSDFHLLEAHIQLWISAWYFHIHSDGISWPCHSECPGPTISTYSPLFLLFQKSTYWPYPVQCFF